MNYWVYENRVLDKTRIHLGSCPYCQDGRGIHGGGDRATGSWVGPLPSVEAAQQAAARFARNDNRTCLQCLPRVAPNLPLRQPENRGRARATPLAPASQPPLDEHTCLIGLRWKSAGHLTLDKKGKIVAPRLEEKSGLYSIRMINADGIERRYIGESDSLRRRFGNYRNPGPTQSTSIRINAQIINLLCGGGAAVVMIATDLWLGHESAVLDIDLREKSVRRLFENLAISLDASRGIQSLNL